MYLTNLCLLLLASFTFVKAAPFDVAPYVDKEDADLSVPQLIEKYGYPVEVHHVTTDDGYILELHRIPFGVAPDAGPKENKPVVFVQHGILSSSADWIIAGPTRGIGYLLADLGYDVWMGNARGNKYSKNHNTSTPDDSKFWNFSWHEIGVHDLPKMIDYALEKTGQKQTFYIGHSQGTTAFFVMCTQRPEYNSKIRAMFSLAPIAYMKHLTSPILKFMAFFDGTLDLLMKMIGVHEFLPNNELISKFGALICKDGAATQPICTNILFILCGFNKDNMDTELLPILMGHTPAGSSTKQMLHYAQSIKSGKFRKWDYGAIKNMLEYKSLHPPKYNLAKITAPVALHYSSNDWLAAQVDVLQLYNELANPIGRFLVVDETFNHLDYLWGKNVVDVVYNQVFSLMTKY